MGVTSGVTTPEVEDWAKGLAEDWCDRQGLAEPVPARRRPQLDTLAAVPTAGRRGLPVQRQLAGAGTAADARHRAAPLELRAALRVRRRRPFRSAAAGVAAAADRRRRRPQRRPQRRRRLGSGEAL